MKRAGVAELADAADSKSAAGHPAWGFNSPLQHQSYFCLINNIQAAISACALYVPAAFSWDPKFSAHLLPVALVGNGPMARNASR